MKLYNFISKLNEELNRYHLMESGIKLNKRLNSPNQILFVSQTGVYIASYTYNYVTGFAKRGLIHASNFLNFVTQHVVSYNIELCEKAFLSLN